MRQDKGKKAEHQSGVQLFWIYQASLLPTATGIGPSGMREGFDIGYGDVNKKRQPKNGW